MANDNVKADSSDSIVQYILVRTDLNWTTGALIAQACHASVATISETVQNQFTKSYLGDLDNMRKVTLRAEKLEDLTSVQAVLRNAGIEHRLWIEKPENIATCLACSPQPKSLVQAVFRHLKLFK